MSTFVWGPSLWRVLHTVAFVDPARLRAHKSEVMNFLGSLGEVLPCIHCRRSYVSFMENMPDLGAVIDRGDLFKYMFELHSKVNRKLDAPSPEYAQVVKRFSVRPQQWCPDDLWDIIALFGLNYAPDKVRPYRVWWEGLISVLEVCGAEPTLLHLLKHVECPCESGAFVATSLILKSAYTGSSAPSREQVSRQTKRYSLGISKTCKDGKCT